jgi:putative PIN family toxin of toxin-antitoxin system
MTSEQQPPRRIVLDPNVVVSAAITPAGAPGRITQLIDAGVLIPIVDEHLVDEVREVLARPKLQKYLDVTKAARAVTELRRLAEWHSDPVDPPKVCRDPDDDYLLALAVAAKADALVTGDDDLHAVPNPGVEVITPSELLDRLPS